MTSFVRTPAEWKSGPTGSALALLDRPIGRLDVRVADARPLSASLREVAHVFFTTVPFGTTGDYADKPWVALKCRMDPSEG